MKKITICLFIAFLLLGALLSCQSEGNIDQLTKESSINTDFSQNKNQYKIALVMKTLTNPFFINMEKGARKAEEDFNIKLIEETGAQETSIEQQIEIVEELITEHVNAIVIAPGSSIELVQVLKKAQNSGIVIVNIDNRLDVSECQKQQLNNVPFISVKNDEAAYQSAKYITSMVRVPAKALILEGIKDAENAKLRTVGAKKAFSENPQISIVASVSANWKIDEAYNASKKQFGEHPDISLVFCGNDMMALGLIQYLKETNNRNAFIAGFDNLDDAQKAIEDGWLKVTIDQRANLQGYLGVQTAVKMIKNENISNEIYVPYKVVTLENLQES